MFLGLRELPYSAGVGVGGDAVVGELSCHPHRALPSGALADKFHEPRLLLVTHGEGFSGGVVAVFLHKLVHDSNGLPGRSRTLQRKVHEGEVVKPAVRVPELLPAVPSGFNDGDLLLVHEAHHPIGVLHLRDVVDLGVRSPALPDGNHLPGLMAPRTREAQRCGKPEAVAVVSAYHAAVHRSFLAHNEVGAGVGIRLEQDCGRNHCGQKG